MTKDKMKSYELVSEIKDERRHRNRVAIVIASYKGNDILKKHIEYLKGQIFRAFDIIVVYGQDDEFLKSKGLDMVHIRRKGDVGAAAAFLIGEKFSLDNGYDMFIESDNYCMPRDSHLVANLVGAIDNGFEYAYPHVRYEHTSIITVTAAIRHYACVSRTLANRVGLVYAPFYMYTDDVEYQRRLLNNASRHTVVEGTINRNYKVKGEFLVSNTYTYYKAKNTIILLRIMPMGFKRLPSIFLTFITFFCIALFKLISGNRIQCAEMIRGICAGAALSMKERKCHDTKYIEDTKKIEFNTVFVDASIKDFFETKKRELHLISPKFEVVYYKRDEAAIADLRKFFLPTLRIFGKNALFFIYFGNFFLYNLGLFFSKKNYVYGDGGFTAIKTKDSMIYRIAFVAVLPAVLILSTILFLIISFNPRKFKTYGYGLKPNA